MQTKQTNPAGKAVIFLFMSYPQSPLMLSFNFVRQKYNIGYPQNFDFPRQSHIPVSIPPSPPQNIQPRSNNQKNAQYHKIPGKNHRANKVRGLTVLSLKSLLKGPMELEGHGTVSFSLPFFFPLSNAKTVIKYFCHSCIEKAPNQSTILSISLMNAGSQQKVGEN